MHGFGVCLAMLFEAMIGFDVMRFDSTNIYCGSFGKCSIMHSSCFHFTFKIPHQKSSPTAEMFRIFSFTIRRISKQAWELSIFKRVFVNLRFEFRRFTHIFRACVFEKRKFFLFNVLFLFLPDRKTLSFFEILTNFFSFVHQHCLYLKWKLVNFWSRKKKKRKLIQIKNASI